MQGAIVLTSIQTILSRRLSVHQPLERWHHCSQFLSEPRLSTKRENHQFLSRPDTFEIMELMPIPLNHITRLTRDLG